MANPPTRFRVRAEGPQPVHFINVTVSIEETDASGHVLSSIFDPHRVTPALSVFLTKRLEIIIDDDVMFAQQRQAAEARGEEREDERFLGISAILSIKEAVWDYVKHRLGIET